MPRPTPDLITVSLFVALLLGACEGLCPTPEDNDGRIILTSVLGTVAVECLVAAPVILILWRRRRKERSQKPVNQNTKSSSGAAEGFDNKAFIETTEDAAEEGLAGYVECKEFTNLQKGKTSRPPSSVAMPGKTWNSLPKVRFGGVSLAHQGSYGSLDDGRFLMEPEVINVTLLSQDFIGLGFNITGSMRDGIFVSQVHNRGPAVESGKLKVGDRILSVTISFENMVFEDALTILSYASPYPVIVNLQKEKAFHNEKKISGIEMRLNHPLYRSQSLDALTKMVKDPILKPKRRFSELRPESKEPSPALSRDSPGSKCYESSLFSNDGKSPKFLITDVAYDSNRKHLDSGYVNGISEVIVHKPPNNNLDDSVDFSSVSALKAEKTSKPAVKLQEPRKLPFKISEKKASKNLEKPITVERPPGTEHLLKAPTVAPLESSEMSSGSAQEFSDLFDSLTGNEFDDTFSFKLDDSQNKDTFDPWKVTDSLDSSQTKEEPGKNNKEKTMPTKPIRRSLIEDLQREDNPVLLEEVELDLFEGKSWAEEILNYNKQEQIESNSQLAQSALKDGDVTNALHSNKSAFLPSLQQKTMEDSDSETAWLQKSAAIGINNVEETILASVKHKQKSMLDIDKTGDLSVPEDIIVPKKIDKHISLCKEPISKYANFNENFLSFGSVGKQEFMNNDKSSSENMGEPAVEELISPVAAKRDKTSNVTRSHQEIFSYSSNGEKTTQNEADSSMNKTETLYIVKAGNGLEGILSESGKNSENIGKARLSGLKTENFSSNSTSDTKLEDEHREQKMLTESVESNFDSVAVSETFGTEGEQSLPFHHSSYSDMAGSVSATDIENQCKLTSSPLLLEQPNFLSVNDLINLPRAASSDRLSSETVNFNVPEYARFSSLEEEKKSFVEDTLDWSGKHLLHSRSFTDISLQDNDPLNSNWVAKHYKDNDRERFDNYDDIDSDSNNSSRLAAPSSTDIYRARDNLALISSDSDSLASSRGGSPEIKTNGSSHLSPISSDIKICDTNPDINHKNELLSPKDDITVSSYGQGAYTLTINTQPDSDA